MYKVFNAECIVTYSRLTIFFLLSVNIVKKKCISFDYFDENV